METILKLGKNEIIIQTGKMAKQANGAVTIQYGDTVVLVTAVSSDEIREGIDFLPLTTEYREKTSAAGRFPGGYIKRENRPTEKEILSARLIDRPIRPLFPEGYFYGLQVMSAVLSADGENDPDVLALNGASAALTISDIPFAGPVGAVRVGHIDDNFVINPTHSELENSTIDIIIAGTKTGISMIEGDTKEISEETMAQAIEFGYGYIRKIIDLQLNFQKKFGKEKRSKPLTQIDQALITAVGNFIGTEINDIICIKEKLKRQDALGALRQKVIEQLRPDWPDTEDSSFALALRKVEKETVRNMILSKGKRIDGRGITDVRPISCEVGILPRTHGSALFTRGETQSLAMTTLGSSSDEQRMEDLTGHFSKTFMLHYNFPPFSVGEVRPVRGPGRREIGHGALAESALSAVIPKVEDFPYTIRIVSDILESNGSSSMASVCGGCLSLMDAGVPIKEPVAGIAMGLIKGKEKTVILTDILGAEDGCGDMDFKVAGTKTGITAFQLDVKLKEGVTMDILKQGLEQAHTARLFILDKMNQTIKEPRKEMSPYAPQIRILQIDPDKIGAVIGPGGRVIKQIISDTGTSIDIEDDGKVTIASTDPDSIGKAIKTIEDLTHEVKPGEIYEGTVRNIMDFGAFVDILPGKSGLVHISELSNHFVKKVDDVVKIGDIVKVVVIEIDNKGRINLSKKQLEKDNEKDNQESK